MTFSCRPPLEVWRHLGGLFIEFSGNSISGLSPDRLKAQKYSGTISVTFSVSGLNS
jgi:hypothetical protein